MTCNCGTEARYVSNGVNDALNYWYCDNCKDIAEASIEDDYSDDFDRMVDDEDQSGFNFSTRQYDPNGPAQDPGVIYWTLDPVTGYGQFVDHTGKAIINLPELSQT